MSYKDDVLAVFKRLHDVSWPVFCSNDYTKNDFWHTANTLDTCADFIIQGSRTWGDLPDQRSQVQEMIQQGYEYFRTVYKTQNGHGQDSPAVWWDDYGWWGITFTKIHQNFAEIFKGAKAPKITQADCLQVARDCWTALGSYSQKVNGSVQPPQKGPVAGGCWNHPPEDNGVQNTVTNALFLVLSSRLFQSTNEQGFLNATANQYLWFRNWFINYLQKQKDCPLPGQQQGLFRCLQPSGSTKFIVVYERPIDPANADYNQGNPPFYDKQLWTGDQGLLLGGLAEVLTSRKAIAPLPIIKQQDPTFPQNAQDMALWMVQGISWLFDTSTVLHEAPLNGDFGTGYAADYATGKGVMMRYLANAMNAVGLNAQSYITASAKAVVASMSSSHQVNFQWNKKTDSKIGTNESQVTTTDRRFEPTAQSAGLDALNAAIRYLGK